MIWNLFFFQIVRLSTAKRLMEVTKYKTGQVRDIESILARYEAEILETRTEIERGYKEPHLNYAFKPYYTQGDYIKIRGIYFSSYLSLDLVEVSSEIQSHIAWAYHYVILAGELKMMNCATGTWRIDTSPPPFHLFRR